MPGLWLGSSVVYDSIGQHQPGFQGNGSRLLMLELHSRYQIGKWDFAGEFVRGTISNTEALNASYAASSVANPTLVPHLFYGGYVQAAYNAVAPRRLHADAVRALRSAQHRRRLRQPAGRGRRDQQPNEKIVTVGASFKIGEGMVLKADYRGYRQNKLPDADEHFNLGNSFNLGVGFSF